MDVMRCGTHLDVGTTGHITRRDIVIDAGCCGPYK